MRLFIGTSASAGSQGEPADSYADLLTEQSCHRKGKASINLIYTFFCMYDAHKTYTNTL